MLLESHMNETEDLGITGRSGQAALGDSPSMDLCVYGSLDDTFSFGTAPQVFVACRV